MARRKEPEKVQEPQLSAGKLDLLETANTIYHASIPIGVTPDDVINPRFFAIYSKQFNTFDEIRAIAEDGSWRATYIVLEADTTWVQVKQLTLDKLYYDAPVANPEEVAALVAEHDVVYRGALKHCIIRKSDGGPIKEGFPTARRAKDWLQKWAEEQVASRSVDAAA